jgi:serine phosphatase RsbU (regulator of sigma subunit)
MGGSNTGWYTIGVSGGLVVRSPLAGAGRIGPRGEPVAVRLRVLLVEDDEADAFLVQELLDEAHAAVDLVVATTLAAAREKLAGIDCVLLDLGLPDAHGLDGLRQILAAVAGARTRSGFGIAVCVLTGRQDEHLGAEAVGVGAQDYLVKGQVEGVLLARALRYAVERKRADENAHRLREVELRQAESARLERGLLPQPLVDTQAVALQPFYRPGRRRGLLGGDFYDAVQTGPDRLELLVGDVCGHGVEEAALGVELRVAWRALMLAGVDEDAVLPAVEQVLVSERRLEEQFATVAMVSVDLTRNRMSVRLAGHPPPVLLADGKVDPLPAPTGLVLGVEPGRVRTATHFGLDTVDWSLLVYTDGLVEGYAEPGEEDRLDVTGLCDLLADPVGREGPVSQLTSWLFDRAEQANGGPLADDVAMLLLSRGGGR